MLTVARIVGQFVEVLLKIRGGSLTHLRVQIDVAGHPTFLTEAEDAVDLRNLQTQFRVQLKIPVVHDIFLLVAQIRYQFDVGVVRAICIERATVVGEEVVGYFHLLCSQRIVVVTVVDFGRIPKVDFEDESEFGVNSDVWKLFLQRLEIGWIDPFKLSDRERLLHGISYIRQNNNK